MSLALVVNCKIINGESNGSFMNYIVHSGLIKDNDSSFDNMGSDLEVFPTVTMYSMTFNTYNETIGSNLEMVSTSLIYETTKNHTLGSSPTHNNLSQCNLIFHPHKLLKYSNCHGNPCELQIYIKIAVVTLLSIKQHQILVMLILINHLYFVKY